MKLTVYPSGNGDCLLLQSGGETMLIDGGVGSSFNRSVLPALKSVKKLDCVYLSHIDGDHIGGLLELMDATLQWRVFQYKKKKDAKAKPPTVPRPPEIGKVWHNAFSDLLEENAMPVTAALQQTAAILAAADGGDPLVDAMKMEQAGLATSFPQALQLRSRLGADQLHIPVNPEYRGELMHIRAEGKAPKLVLGKMRLTLIGPAAADLETLRIEWNEWLHANAPKVKKLRDAAKRDAGSLTAAADPTAPFAAAGNALAQSLRPLDPEGLKGLGKRGPVTTPNLASLMFLGEENGKTILLTGDGYWDDILKGLEQAGKLGKDGKGNLHVNVLKVQHHGAQFNMSQEFARRITADHYVFCGNGYQRNPELVVIDVLARSRFGDPGERSTNPKANGKFKFWFNSSRRSAQFAQQMKAVEERVKQYVPASQGRLSYAFHDEPFEVPLQ